MALMLDEIDDIEKKFLEFIASLKNPNITDKIINNLINDVNSVYQKRVDSFNHSPRKFKFTTDAIENLSKKVNNMFRKLNFADDLKAVDRFKNTNILNDWINFISQMQLRINAFTTAFYRDRYYLSMKYRNTIDDLFTMSRFVKAMIAKGIPAKYIMMNAYIAATDKINSLSSGDNSVPVSGESRGILFPEDSKHIFKFALSGWGITSNKAEYDMYNKIKSMPIAKNFAKIEQEYGIFTGILCERIHGDTLDNSNRTVDVDAFRNRINSELKKNNVDIVVEDLHRGNIMFDDRSKELKIIDYGWQN